MKFAINKNSSDSPKNPICWNGKEKKKNNRIDEKSSWKNKCLPMAQTSFESEQNNRRAKVFKLRSVCQLFNRWLDSIDCAKPCSSLIAAIRAKLKLLIFLFLNNACIKRCLLNIFALQSFFVLNFTSSLSSFSHSFTRYKVARNWNSQISVIFTGNYSTLAFIA